MSHFGDTWWDVFRADLDGKLLWHYTSEAAAKSIIAERKLRLFSARFMNDPAEGKLATALIESECRELVRAKNWELTALASTWPGVQRGSEELFLTRTHLINDEV